MARLRMMRAPQKYVQGKDSLFKFHEEMKDLGNKFLFVCSRSGYKMCHDKIEKSFAGTDDVRRYEIFGGVSSVGEIERMRQIVRENGLTIEQLAELMAIDFAAHDLSLYLDTHADDAEAFAVYQDFLKLAEEGARRYAELYGPITKSDLINAEMYTWLKSPWPWEYRGGTEG